MVLPKPNYYSGTNLIAEVAPSYRLDFLYDENGQLYGVIKDNESKYFYVKDCLGTILGIVNESGTLVARYSYSAFGRCIVKVNKDDISIQNPFRFKGYYYDTESGMYYCHTRYFVPEWGRWLNADRIDNFCPVCEHNLFRYCYNNPIDFMDDSGCRPIISHRVDKRGGKVHIHVFINEVQYSWNIDKTPHDKCNKLGYQDLSKTQKKWLAKAGIPNEFLMRFGEHSNWREQFINVQLPPSREYFPYEEKVSHIESFPINSGHAEPQESFQTPSIPSSREYEPLNDGTTVVIVAFGIVLVGVCIVGAFFTGGQSLWGLACLI